MNYWIFKANPAHYRIEDRLRDPNPNIVWAITKFYDKILPGDIVFVWRAGTIRGDAPFGICAVMEILTNPFEPIISELLDGYQIMTNMTSTNSSSQWAKCRIHLRFPIIESSEIKKIPGLEQFSFFKAFQQATNFTVSPQEGAILLKYVEKVRHVHLAEEISPKGFLHQELPGS